MVWTYPSISVKTFVVRQERCTPIYEVKKGATRPKTPENAVVCVRFQTMQKMNEIRCMGKGEIFRKSPSLCHIPDQTMHGHSLFPDQTVHVTNQVFAHAAPWNLNAFLPIILLLKSFRYCRPGPNETACVISLLSEKIRMSVPSYTLMAYSNVSSSKKFIFSH